MAVLRGVARWGGSRAGITPGGPWCPSLSLLLCAFGGCGCLVGGSGAEVACVLMQFSLRLRLAVHVYPAAFVGCRWRWSHKCVPSWYSSVAFTIWFVDAGSRMLWLLVQLRSVLVVLSTRLDLAVTNAACVGLLGAGGESNELCARCSLAVSFGSVFN